MTVRLTRSALLLMLLVLLVTAATGCNRSLPASRQETAHSTTATVPLPRPVPADLAAGDPAVWAAVEFELQHCQWDWHTPLAVYVGAQRTYASPEYGQQIAASANQASWQQEVVKEQQAVTCTVSSPIRVPNAPSTAEQVYVRMTADSHITSTRGSFDAGSSTASWIVQLLDGRWLVTGPFEGG